MLKRLFLIIVFTLFASDCALAASVRFGIFPSNDPAKLHRVMASLATYLQEKTGDSVEIVVTRDYDELLERLQNHTLDLAWINTLNYIRIKSALPEIRYVTTYVEKNTTTGTMLPFYHSYIVTLNDSGIKDLAAARDKIFAFTDPSSTSGYAYPSRLLHDMGIIPKNYFKKVFFLKRHDRVVNALLTGAIDLGAMSDGTFHTAQTQNGQRFTILAQSAPIPLDAVVANVKLPAEKVTAYRQALTSMPSTHPFCQMMYDIIGWPAAGFETRNDTFYDSARAALQQ